ncbi:MAG: hypothetical protein QOH16_3093 [Gaiellaceae bacterium]|jgi:hypothetical protein|nr:hypothetical protein [Gaiellaceae bacterium]
MAAELNGFDWFLYDVVWEMSSEPPIWEPFWGVGQYFPRDTPQEEMLECSRWLLRVLYVDRWAQFVRLRNKMDMAGIGVEGHVMTGAEVEVAIVDPRWSDHPDIFGQWVILRPTPKTIAWQETNGTPHPRAWDEQGGWESSRKE